jgi:hypothetical protein
MTGVSALILSLEARLLQRMSGQVLPWWNAPSEATRIDRSTDLPQPDEASAS